MVYLYIINKDYVYKLISHFSVSSYDRGSIFHI